MGWNDSAFLSTSVLAYSNKTHNEKFASLVIFMSIYSHHQNNDLLLQVIVLSAHLSYGTYIYRTLSFLLPHVKLVSFNKCTKKTNAVKNTLLLMPNELYCFSHCQLWPANIYYFAISGVVGWCDDDNEWGALRQSAYVKTSHENHF